MAETYIEAAFNGPDGSQDGHFFLGDHFVTYDWATRSRTKRREDGVGMGNPGNLHSTAHRNDGRGAGRA